MKTACCLTAILISIFIVSPARAQTISLVPITSAPLPTGSGARALGFGGAFTAVADDATAASWNPAGLTQLDRPEISAVGSLMFRTEDYTSQFKPETESDSEITRGDLNYFSVVYPFRMLGSTMVLSANYQQLYDFDRKLDFGFNRSAGPLTLRENVKFRQSGGIGALSLAYAVRPHRDFAAGITLNYITDEYFGGDAFTERTRQTGGGTLGVLPITTETLLERSMSSFHGINFTIGLMWKAGPVVTLGFVVDTPFTADAIEELNFRSRVGFPTLSSFPDQVNSFQQRQRVEMDFPLSYGAGLALRFSDELTVGLDVFRTDWSDFVIRMPDGRENSPIDGRPAGETDIESTTAIRFGIEYLFVLERVVVPLRAGAFYDPEPSHLHPEDFYGFSVGTGIVLDPLVIDFAYHLRMGRGVEGDVLGVPGTEANVTQNLFIISAIYYF